MLENMFLGRYILVLHCGRKQLNTACIFANLNGIGLVDKKRLCLDCIFHWLYLLFWHHPSLIRPTSGLISEIINTRAWCGLRTSHALLSYFATCAGRTGLMSKIIIGMAPRFYNQLPISIRNKEDILDLKPVLRKLLMEKAFGLCRYLNI